MKDHFPRTIRSRYFPKRELDIGPDEIVVVACMRNEYPRLPYFLDYYRKLGVTRFLLVDNNSSDGTCEFLAGQRDVEYFWTDSSYRGSSAGRLWMQELADTYAIDRWVITVDVDELLVFPGAETLTLPDLCAYIDDNHQDGLYAALLDMYSDRPLSQTRYLPGSDFLDTCRYFETDTYWLAPGSNPPFLSIFGGPRHQLFKTRGGTGGKPMMKKIPLVKWREGFSYMFSTHSHRFIRLADITGALLHFKFFDTFQAMAAAEAERGDRRQQEHYSTYRETVENDVCFYGTQSHLYRTPADLVRLGVMCSTERYARFVAGQVRASGGEVGLQELLPPPVAAEGSLTLRSVAAVWPLVNNPAMAQYFGHISEPTKDRRLAFVSEMGRFVKVIDVKPDHLLVQIEEPALHRWRRSRLGMGVYVGRRLVRNVLVDGSEDGLLVETESLEPNICRLDVDIAGAALLEGGHGRSVTVTVYLIDGDDEIRMRDRPLGFGSARPEDTLIYTRSWFPEGGFVGLDVGFRGATGRLKDGTLRGWAYDAERDSFDVPVCIYLNGRLARHAWPTERRTDLDNVRNPGSSARGRGFLVDLPLGYFDGEYDVITVEAVVAGRNLSLRHSPLILPAKSRDARWDEARKEWIVHHADHSAAPEPATVPWWRAWA